MVESAQKELEQLSVQYGVIISEAIIKKWEQEEKGAIKITASQRKNGKTFQISE